MKSPLASFLIISSWFFIIACMVYEYALHGTGTIYRLLHPSSTYETFFHLLILTVPAGSTTVALLLEQKIRLLAKLQTSDGDLRHAAEEWRATFDSMPFGAALINEDCTIVRANKFLADLSNTTPKALVSSKCSSILSPCDENAEKSLCDPLKDSIRTKKAQSMEYYDRGLDRHFVITVTPVSSETVDATSYIQSVIDISGIKLNEMKILQSRDAFLNMLKDAHTAYKELKELHSGFILAFAIAIDAKSPWTKGHSERVALHSVNIAKELGFSDSEIDDINTGALLHDLGKIGTYDIILEKPERLTEEEFTLVKLHPIEGEKILKPLKYFEHILPMIRNHHERFDGRGYPDRLRGEGIPLCARILCVADAFDSMTANRPYRPSPGKAYAIAELNRCNGTQFDPVVVEAFLKTLDKK